MIKQRQESIAIYEQNGRPELAQPEREEVEVIASFLPRQMDEAETKAAIEAAIAETGAGLHEGHGQGHRGAARRIRRPDGFRQGESPRRRGSITQRPSTRPALSVVMESRAAAQPRDDSTGLVFAIPDLRFVRDDGRWGMDVSKSQHLWARELVGSEPE